MDIIPPGPIRVIYSSQTYIKQCQVVVDTIYKIIVNLTNRMRKIRFKVLNTMATSLTQSYSTVLEIIIPYSPRRRRCCCCLVRTASVSNSNKLIFWKILAWVFGSHFHKVRLTSLTCEMQNACRVEETFPFRDLVSG